MAVGNHANQPTVAGRGLHLDREVGLLLHEPPGKLVEDKQVEVRRPEGRWRGLKGDSGSAPPLGAGFTAKEPHNSTARALDSIQLAEAHCLDGEPVGEGHTGWAQVAAKKAPLAIEGAVWNASKPIGVWRSRRRARGSPDRWSGSAKRRVERRCRHEPC
jgi:hypothetical protein